MAFSLQEHSRMLLYSSTAVHPAHYPALAPALAPFASVSSSDKKDRSRGPIFHLRLESEPIGAEETMKQLYS